MMRKFENHVQEMKYEVLKEVSRAAFQGNLEEAIPSIPFRTDPGPSPRIRCCIHKERVITMDRIRLALGGDKKNPNIIEVIDEACDECTINRFIITEACRGCLAHRCTGACPVNAISIIGFKAVIDQEKCIECGKCKESCPYNAVADVMRPCRRACEVGALSIDEQKKAVIDEEKCIRCGACVYQCPFGAIMDKSSINDVIKILKESKVSKTSQNANEPTKSKNGNKEMKVYAIIAPSISSQFTYASIGQVIGGIKTLGFHDVIEVALGADMVALEEAREYRKVVGDIGTMTSSCCPAFVDHVYKVYPELKKHLSSLVSPMIAISRLIKSMDPEGKVVFVGPCTAKKEEIQKKDLKGATDFVLTFEELAAMLDSQDIALDQLEESPLDNASFYGRIFARSGGLTKALGKLLEEEPGESPFNPITCDGILECDKALKRLKFRRLEHNFIEGMACKGGCIGGAASLSHGPKDKSAVDKYGKMALEPNQQESLRVFDLQSVEYHRDHQINAAQSILKDAVSVNTE